ncbi:hypothetical protein [Corallincola spongiicola]|uniref:DUF3012 domain-containing protein n=1 Tax=Corallincola spongiicola TaxID=2520508 RepID=A0ABY1WQL5_9GAMM|nr:hypothetical protein [Corallincola spongiicola]TAA46878.1 hypothetical protein EXY25_06380 [Corallincola spongiicola]
MIRSKIFLSSAATVVLSSIVAFHQWPTSASLGDACSCEAESITFDASLPVSHPANRCSLQNKASNESWWAWLAGDSRSAEYHFIDLLELLSRSNTTDKPISPKEPQS